jgi:hypothetical protein
MSDKEVIDYIESEAKDWDWNHLDLNWEIIGEGVINDE